MVKAKDMFDCCNGNSDLTEEFIYRHVHLQSDVSYEVLSGMTEEGECIGYLPFCKDSKSRDIKVFQGRKGILVARNGKAGTMRYLPEGKYMINDHAYILSLKDSIKHMYPILEREEEAFLKYFIYAYSAQMKRFATKNDNATWNKTAFFREQEISEADFIEENLMKFKQTNDSLEEIGHRIDGVTEQIAALNRKLISLDSVPCGASVSLNHIFEYCSRNDALSEEGIYLRQPNGNDLTVLSGSSDNLIYGKINKDDKKIHYIENTQCLHLISRGNAGKLTYFPKGDYATNTNAFLLFLKPDYKTGHRIDTDEKEEIILKFYASYLQPGFFELSSKSGLGVFPLTDAMASFYVPAFDFCDEVESVVKTIEEFEAIKRSVYVLKGQYDSLRGKQLLPFGT